MCRRSLTLTGGRCWLVGITVGGATVLRRRCRSCDSHFCGRLTEHNAARLIEKFSPIVIEVIARYNSAAACIPVLLSGLNAFMCVEIVMSGSILLYWPGQNFHDNSSKSPDVRRLVLSGGSVHISINGYAQREQLCRRLASMGWTKARLCLA